MASCRELIRDVARLDIAARAGSDDQHCAVGARRNRKCVSRFFKRRRIDDNEAIAPAGIPQKLAKGVRLKQVRRFPLTEPAVSKSRPRYAVARTA